MGFHIRGLDPEAFRPLQGLDDAALARAGALRCIADSKPGFPDRVSLLDAEPGEAMLLLNFEHQPGDTPYRSRHAVYVRESLPPRFDAVDRVPEILRPRLLSVRAFDPGHQMIDADVVDGSAVEDLLERLLANPRAGYLHVHFAKRGCFACRVDRP